MAKKIIVSVLVLLTFALIASSAIFLGLMNLPEQTDNPEPDNSGIFYAMTSIGETRSGTISDSVIQSAIENSCNPDEGYAYCYEHGDTNRYGDARAEAYTKVQVSNLNAVHIEGNYYVGEVKLHYNMQGDRFYFAENVNNWDTLWDRCYKSGCRDTSELSSGVGTRVVASQPGQQYTGCPVFYAWDYDYNEASNGDWSWTWVTAGSGWIGSNNCFDVKVVECIDNSDCTNQRVCDTSGDWTTWSCVERPKMNYYTYDEITNQCSSNIKFVDEKTDLDYETFEDCESNIKSNANTIIVIVLVAALVLLILVSVIIKLRNRK